VTDRRPERERYRRASLREQLGEELRSFLGNTPLVALAAALLGGWLILQVTRPQVVRVADVRPGDCLYIRAADADTDVPGGRAIGSDGAVLIALFEQSAERAPCDGSHSHEVADAWQLDAAAGAAYPGNGGLAGEQEARCEAAFEAHVGRPSEGSSLQLTTGLPTERAWDAGVRTVVCLVSNADGSFLPGPARASRR
jgi:hypothetical protein